MTVPLGSSCEQDVFRGDRHLGRATWFLHALIKRDFAGDLSGREERATAAAVLAAKDTVDSRVAAGVLGVGFLSMIFLGGPAALLAVPLTYGAVLLARFRVHRRRIHEHPVEGSARIALPDPASYSDPAAHAAIRRLRDARARLRDVIRGGPLGSESDSMVTLPGAGEVERRVVVLAARVEYLGAFLGGLSFSDLERELERVRTMRTPSVVATFGSELDLAISQREAHLQDARLLASKRERLLVALDHMLSVLESLPLRLTTLQLARAESLEDHPPSSTSAAAPVLDGLEAIYEVFASCQRASASLEDPGSGGRVCPRAW